MIDADRYAIFAIKRLYDETVLQPLKGAYTVNGTRAFLARWLFVGLNDLNLTSKFCTSKPIHYQRQKGSSGSKQSIFAGVTS